MKGYLCMGDIKTFVIVPVGEDVERLRWCLQGLEAQSDPDFGVVIALDSKGGGSDDALWKRFTSWYFPASGRAAILAHLPPEPGSYRPSATRNIGAAAAIERGADLLIFLDGDCIPDPDFVAAHKAAYDAWPDDLSFGFRRHLPESFLLELETVTDAEMLRHAVMEPRQHCLPETPTAWDVFSCNMSVQSSVFAQLNGFDNEYDGAWGGEDTDFAARFVAAKVPCMDLSPLQGGYVTHVDHARRAVAESANVRRGMILQAMAGERPVVCANGLEQTKGDLKNEHDGDKDSGGGN